MTKMKKSDCERWEMLHLDEEEIVLLAEGNIEASEDVYQHLASCSACEEKVSAARDLFRIEPLYPGRSRLREEALMDCMRREGVLQSAPPGVLKVVLQDGAVEVLETTMKVHVSQRLVATRRQGGGGEAPGVAFFRQLGEVEMEVHLVRVPRGRFHLAVGLKGSGEARRFSVALHRGGRRLSVEPATLGSVTFKHLKPGVYRLEVLEGGTGLGHVEVGVEARYSSEEEV